MTSADLGLVFAWVQDPEICRWWGDPPLSQEEVNGKYISRIDGSENIDCLIVELDRAAFAFLQWYRLADHPDHPGFTHVGPNYAGIDLFIGRSEMRNRGLGSKMLRQFMIETIKAKPEITGFVIDPSVENVRAIASYRKAGFIDVEFGTDAETGKPCLIQIAERSSLLSDRHPNPTADHAHADQNQE